jgi:hypothetical protein
VKDSQRPAHCRCGLGLTYLGRSDFHQTNLLTPVNEATIQLETFDHGATFCTLLRGFRLTAKTPLLRIFSIGAREFLGDISALAVGINRDKGGAGGFAMSRHGKDQRCYELRRSLLRAGGHGGCRSFAVSTRCHWNQSHCSGGRG